MSLFICEQCKCIENTSLGFWWVRKEITGGPALCSECGPATYDDGSPTRFAGKWHGFFDKRHATDGDIAVGPNRVVNPAALGRSGEK